MKIIALGDTHGRNYWESIWEKHSDADYFVFIGDYFDSKEGITAEQQLENFQKIVALKKQHPQKVILLFGNHDYHYTDLVPTIDKYSGYQFNYASLICKAIKEALDEKLFQMCFKYENFLFSHAGISKRWCDVFLKIKEENNFLITNIDELVNNLFYNNPEKFAFAMGANFDFEGDDICQTPIWIRPPSLLKNKINGYTQIVGHTVQNQINLNQEVIFIDTFEKSKEYLIIEGFNSFKIDSFNE
ncbi:MAG: hypothetical protein RLZZ175_1495 [Bacteroidota bacterium]|jgi:hypothetical protein